MATNHIYRDRAVQLSEATTVKRTVTFGIGTDEAKTLTLRKAGGAFAAGTSTWTTIAANVAEVTLTAADLDTTGELVLKLAGATDTDYVYGLLVTDHDPFADIAAILDDTGTSGVALGSGSIGADAFDERVLYYPQKIQVNEATTAKRTIYYQAGTVEAQTVTVSKGGADFVASSAAESTVDSKLYALQLTTDDIDTIGDLAVKLEGATSTQYIVGLRVTNEDPYDDINLVARRVAGKTVSDTDANTIVVYDNDGVTALVTLTKSTAGTETTWTPS